MSEYNISFSIRREVVLWLIAGILIILSMIYYNIRSKVPEVPDVLPHEMIQIKVFEEDKQITIPLELKNIFGEDSFGGIALISKRGVVAAFDNNGKPNNLCGSTKNKKGECELAIASRSLVRVINGTIRCGTCTTFQNDAIISCEVNSQTWYCDSRSTRKCNRSPCVEN